MRQLYLLLTIITDYYGFCNIVLEICYMWFLQVFDQFSWNSRRSTSSEKRPLRWHSLKTMNKEGLVNSCPLCVIQGFLPRSFEKVSRATRNWRLLHNKDINYIKDQKIPLNLSPYRRFQKTKSPRGPVQVFLRRQATSLQKMETTGRGTSPYVGSRFPFYHASSRRVQEDKDYLGMKALKIRKVYFEIHPSSN